MNSLQRIGTTNAGNALFLFPAVGHLFYFSRVDYGTIRLHTVDTLTGVEREYDEFSTFEELPEPVRKAITTSNYRMRSTKTTLEGVMAHD